MKLDEFYLERPERAGSGESDYGVWWTDNGLTWPHYRVSYIEATGEVYAVNLSTSEVEVLGVVVPSGKRRYYEALDRILEGWPERCVSPSTDSLEWVRNRLAMAAKV